MARFPSDKLVQLREGLGKRATFIKSVQSLEEFVTRHYAISSAEERKQIFEVVARAGVVVTTRYTRKHYWQPCLHLFMTTARYVASDQQRLGKIQEWISIAQDVLTSCEKIPDETVHMVDSPSSANTDNATNLEQGIQNLLVSLFGENLEDFMKPVTVPTSRDARYYIPVITVQDQNVSCTVCLESFPVKGKAKQLPCGHLFHYDCLMPWLEQNHTCPVCRHDLPQEIRFYEDNARQKVQDQNPNVSSPSMFC